MSIKFEIDAFQPNEDKFQTEEQKKVLNQYWTRASEQVRILNRFIFLEWASARMIAGWVPAATDFDDRCMLTRFMAQNMLIADRLRERKKELQNNDTIQVPSEAVLTAIQDLGRADGYYAFVAGWYLELQTNLIRCYERFSEGLDAIFDAPTLDLLEELLPKKRKQVEWAKQLVHDAVHNPSVLKSVESWRTYVRSYLLFIGDLDERSNYGIPKPTTPVESPYGPAPEKRTRPEWLKVSSLIEPPTEFAGSLKTFMWHYATEIQVVDPMCYVFYGIDDMPFEFYVDFSRHIWDESRHHQMGARRLKQMGYDLRDVPLPFGENALKNLEDYYSQLTMVGETCSFTRKKKSMDAYYKKGDVISGMTAEIDIIDERRHVGYGKKWAQKLYERVGDHRSLEQIIKDIIMTSQHAELSKLTQDEKESLTHFAFCSKIEFKYLNFEKL
jgi:hypothetical protein